MFVLLVWEALRKAVVSSDQYPGNAWYQWPYNNECQEKLMSAPRLRNSILQTLARPSDSAWAGRGQGYVIWVSVCPLQPQQSQAESWVTGVLPANTRGAMRCEPGRQLLARLVTEQLSVDTIPRQWSSSLVSLPSSSLVTSADLSKIQVFMAAVIFLTFCHWESAVCRPTNWYFQCILNTLLILSEINVIYTQVPRWQFLILRRLMAISSWDASLLEVKRNISRDLKFKCSI